MGLKPLIKSTPASALAKVMYFGTFGMAIILGSPAASFACSCGPDSNVAAAVEQASVVFIGRVETVRASQFRSDQNEVKVVVSRVFKDDIGMVPQSSSSVRPDEVVVSTVTLFTSQQESMCGYPFTAGLDYVIFARGNLARLSVSMCSQTRILDGATELIAELEKGALDKQVQSVAGSGISSAPASEPTTK